MESMEFIPMTLFRRRGGRFFETARWRAARRSGFQRQLRTVRLARGAVLRGGAREREVANGVAAHRTRLAGSAVRAHRCDLRGLELVDRDAAARVDRGPDGAHRRVEEAIELDLGERRGVRDG